MKSVYAKRSVKDFGVCGERYFLSSGFLWVFFEDMLWRLESDNGERKTENEDVE